MYYYLSNAVYVSPCKAATVNTDRFQAAAE